MRDYKRVSPRFWTEAQAGGWTDDMKMLALYLLTCEHRTTEGLYRLPVEYMAADLSGADGLGADLADSWSPERVRTALAQLSADGFVRYDHAARVVFLPRALAYQAPENPNQRRAAVKSLRELPETPLFEAFLEAARTWCPKLAQAFAQPLAEPFEEPLAEPLGEPFGKGLAEPLAEPFGERLAEPPAPSPAPTPAPEELVAAAAAATASLPGEEQEKPAAFADYWAAYPRKVGESEARKRWGRLSDASRLAAVAAAGHLADYAAGASVDLQYVPYPGTFIGPKRTFEDWSQGLPAGYASQAARKAEDGPILCVACGAEVTPDDVFEADYLEGRGWLHERCRERRTA